MDTEKLWAEYGRLSAKCEQLQGILAQLTAQARKIHAQIMEAETKKELDKDNG